MNRQQKRALKKNGELNNYIEKFCLDFTNILVDNYFNKDGKQDLQGVHEKVESLMKIKGEELGNKVKEILQKQQGIKMNMRAQKERG